MLRHKECLAEGADPIPRLASLRSRSNSADVFNEESLKLLKSFHKSVFRRGSINSSWISPGLRC